jgi:DNA-binding MarR family transcriptional regulator
VNAIPVHLAALSSLLASDVEAGQLHTQHLRLLALLCASDHPLSLSQVAALGGVSLPSASRLIRRLVDREFVSRAVYADNWRTVSLSPTQAGRDLDARVRAHVTTATAA